MLSFFEFPPASEESHSGLPEPYKSLLAHKKHLVFQHRKVSLEKCLTEGEAPCMAQWKTSFLKGNACLNPCTNHTPKE